MLPDKIKPAGFAPSLLVKPAPELLNTVWLKVCSVANPLPLVLRAKIMPLPFVPSNEVTPYRMFPETTTPAMGLPLTVVVSLLLVKSYTSVKVCAVARLEQKTATSVKMENLNGILTECKRLIRVLSLS